jgi:hypothetical protein
MPNWIRQHVRLAMVAAVLIVGGIVAATVAASASSSQPPAASSPPAPTTVSQQHTTTPSTMSINLTAAGFTIPGPNPRPAGPVTIRVSTPDKIGHYLYTAQLRGSTTVADVSQWSAAINGSNMAAHLKAVHLLYKNVDYTGGVVVYPATPASFTIDLKPGLYYFYDTPAYNDTDDDAAIHLPAGAGQVQTMAAFSGPSHLNALQVVASGSQPAAVKSPHVDGVIHLVMEHGQPRFQIPASLPRDGTFLFRSDINQPAQAIFRKVPVGYTNSRLQANFSASLAGETDLPNPLSSSPGGLTTISPGNSIIVHLDFPAATYAVLSFLEDPSNGVHRAYEGLHSIVVMH